jgi:hypothetical protein
VGPRGEGDPRLHSRIRRQDDLVRIPPNDVRKLGDEVVAALTVVLD